MFCLFKAISDRTLVDPRGLEPRTSSLSGKRSNPVLVAPTWAFMFVGARCVTSVSHDDVSLIDNSAPPVLDLPLARAPYTATYHRTKRDGAQSELSRG